MWMQLIDTKQGVVFEYNNKVPRKEFLQERKIKRDSKI